MFVERKICMNVNVYLKWYNLAALMLWGLLVMAYAGGGCVFDDEAMYLLAAAQGVALLEILHARMGWVKSPWLSVAAQVLSRIFVVVVLGLYYKKVTHPLFVYGTFIVSLAWSITEVVRYAYYLMQLLERETGWLTWLRYSLFIVLYPLGVCGEWLLIATAVAQQSVWLSPFTWVSVLVALLYILYFPKLYGYMWKQRKKKLSPRLEM
ncbi:MAG: protein tyrosine phosphatase-like domain-containing protein [Chitinophagales bacterium]|nr:protein tyrosine phosphatase-like domain-containing protein [Chitinophagales bacterium]